VEKFKQGYRLTSEAQGNWDIQFLFLFLHSYLEGKAHCSHLQLITAHFEQEHEQDHHGEGAELHVYSPRGKKSSLDEHEKGQLDHIPAFDAVGTSWHSIQGIRHVRMTIVATNIVHASAVHLAGFVNRRIPSLGVFLWDEECPGRCSKCHASGWSNMVTSHDRRSTR